MTANGQPQQQLTEEQRRERKNQADRDRRQRQKEEREQAEAMSTKESTVKTVTEHATPKAPENTATPSIMDMKLGDLKAKLAAAQDQAAFQQMALEVFQSIDKQLSAVVGAIQGLTNVIQEHVDNVLGESQTYEGSTADNVKQNYAAVLLESPVSDKTLLTPPTEIAKVTIEETSEELTASAVAEVEEGAEEEVDDEEEEVIEPEVDHYIMEGSEWYKITRVAVSKEGDPVYWTKAKNGGAKVRLEGNLEFVKLSKKGTPLWQFVSEE